MLVSVIVPNYNHATFLPQRLESVFVQTYSDFEVIILDDCSTDNSTDIIEQYRPHPKVSHIVYNRHNSGSAFKQWQKGIGLAKGEWIWIAESDDYCTKDLLNVLTGQAISNNNVVLSYCQSIEVDENGEGRRDMKWFTDQADKEHWQNDYCNNGQEEIRNYLWQLNALPNASAVLFKKEAFVHANKNFETMKMCGDWLLWIEIAKQGNVCFCATAHNFFRKHNATTRTLETNGKRRTRAEEEYKIIQVAQAFVDGSNLHSLQKKQARILRNYSSLFERKEVINYLFHPRSYKKPFPYLRFIGVYFAGTLYRKTKKIFGSFFF